MKVVFTCYIYEFHKNYCYNIAEEIEHRGGEVIFADKGSKYDNVDFTIQPDEAYPRYGGKGIWINHAMPVLPQNDFYNGNCFHYNIENNTDYIFTFSEEWADWHRSKYCKPTYVVGYPRLDKIFNNTLKDGTVLFAPTHHLKPGVYYGDTINVNSLMKHCFNVGYKWFIHREHPAYNKNQMPLEECYKRASLVITDYSSVGLEAITLNIPTILIGNIEWLNEKNYHISRLSDIGGSRVYNTTQLNLEIEKYIKNPKYLERERLECSKRLCDYQGCAAKRMVDMMEELL